MNSAIHFRYEVLRTVRNRVFYGATLALPLVLFFGVASGQRHATFNGTSFPLYFMTAMAVYGSMFAVVGLWLAIIAACQRCVRRYLAM